MYVIILSILRISQGRSCLHLLNDWLAKLRVEESAGDDYWKEVLCVLLDYAHDAVRAGQLLWHATQAFVAMKLAQVHDELVPLFRAMDKLGVGDSQEVNGGLGTI